LTSPDAGKLNTPYTELPSTAPSVPAYVTVVAVAASRLLPHMKSVVCTRASSYSPSLAATAPRPPTTAEASRHRAAERCASTPGTFSPKDSPSPERAAAASVATVGATEANSVAADSFRVEAFRRTHKVSRSAATVSACAPLAPPP
jgi:hypothetical protein